MLIYYYSLFVQADWTEAFRNVRNHLMDLNIQLHSNQESTRYCLCQILLPITRVGQSTSAQSCSLSNRVK